MSGMFDMFSICDEKCRQIGSCETDKKSTVARKRRDILVWSYLLMRRVNKHVDPIQQRDIEKKLIVSLNIIWFLLSVLSAFIF